MAVEQLSNCSCHCRFEFTKQLFKVKRVPGRVSVLTIQLCDCHAKAAIDSMETAEYGCAPIKFYLWTLRF